MISFFFFLRSPVFLWKCVNLRWTTKGWTTLTRTVEYNVFEVFVFIWMCVDVMRAQCGLNRNHARLCRHCRDWSFSHTRVHRSFRVVFQKKLIENLKFFYFSSMNNNRSVYTLWEGNNRVSHEIGRPTERRNPSSFHRRDDLNIIDRYMALLCCDNSALHYDLSKRTRVYATWWFRPRVAVVSI